MKLQVMVPTLITAAFLSTAYGGDTYWDSASHEHRTMPEDHKYFTTTHVPGDEVGKHARPRIKLSGWDLHYASSGDDLRSICEKRLRETFTNACYEAGVYDMPSQGGVYHPDKIKFPDARDEEDGGHNVGINGKGTKGINRRHAASNDLCVHEWGGLGWDSSKGVAYIQATGGYCYYYNRGSESGRGGQNLWRYDVKECTGGSDDHWGCSE